MPNEERIAVLDFLAEKVLEALATPSLPAHTYRSVYQPCTVLDATRELMLTCTVCLFIMLIDLSSAFCRSCCKGRRCKASSCIRRPLQRSLRRYPLYSYPVLNTLPMLSLCVFYFV